MRRRGTRRHIEPAYSVDSQERQGLAKKEFTSRFFTTRLSSANSLPLSAVIVWIGTLPEPSSRIVIGPTASFVFSSTRPTNVYFAARSTNDTIAPLCPLPTMVSASQSQIRTFSSTMAGRSECPIGQGYGPDRHGFRISSLASCRVVEDPT